MADNLFFIKGEDYADMDKNDRRTLRDAYFSENNIKLRWSALFIAILQILFVVRDVLAGFYQQHSLNYINLGIEITMIALSTAYFVYMTAERKTSGVKQSSKILYTVYMFAIAFSVVGYTFTDMCVRQSNIGVCIAFLFVPIIVPFFSFAEQLTLFLTVAIPSTVFYCMYFTDGILGATGMMILYLLMFLTSDVLRVFFIRILIYSRRDKKMRDELIRLNKTDFLTKSWTRSCIYDDYKEAQINGNPIGIMIYDIDDFKMYNDTFSYMKGDVCLKDTAAAVDNLVHNYGGKLYRYGGEEFVATFDGIGEEVFDEILPKISETIYGLKIHHAPTALYPYVSVSVGGVYSKGGNSVEEVLQACDNALYKAKSRGKNCCVKSNIKASG